MSNVLNNVINTADRCVEAPHYIIIPQPADVSSSFNALQKGMLNHCDETEKRQALISRNFAQLNTAYSMTANTSDSTAQEKELFKLIYARTPHLIPSEHALYRQLISVAYHWFKNAVYAKNVLANKED